LRFIVQKILYLIPTLFGISLVAFAFIHAIPGDPITIMAGERGISPARHAELMAQLGLDKPLWQQYCLYIWQVLHGDFGVSYVSKTPILTEFMQLFPATLELAVCALILAIIIGIPAGMLAAIKRGSIFDQAAMGGSLLGYSMPIFWWGMLLVMLFSGYLGWTPVSGRIDLDYYFEPTTGFMLIDSLLSGEEGAFSSAVSHLILPSIVLATVPLAVIARQTRSAMLEVLGEDYMRTARAKGLSSFRIYAVHAARNAMIPVVTTIGLQVSGLIAGAILTETIFSWPGIGKWIVDAIFKRDYMAVQGGILIIAILVMAVNLAVDIICGMINPRVSKA